MIAAYLVWKQISFFQQKYEKCIELFIVTLVSDCSGYVFSRPILNKHFRYAAIENVYTIDKHRSKIVRNRVFDCRLWPNSKLFLVAVVLDWFGYVFSRPIFNKHFRYAAIENVYSIDDVDLRSLETEFLIAFCSPTVNYY